MMTSAELEKKEIELELDYLAKLKALRENWVKENARFEKGEFIFSGSSIIKVENITYTTLGGGYIQVRYDGFVYRKVKGKLERIKSEKEMVAVWGDYLTKYEL